MDYALKLKTDISIHIRRTGMNLIAKKTNISTK